MKITFKKQFNQLIPYSLEDKDKLESMADDAVYEIDIKSNDIRTLAQNKAIHTYFSLLADALNEGGLTVAKMIKIEVEWTPTSVKELLWRPIQEAVINKKSTTKLKKNEITKIYETLNLALATKFGLVVMFPSREDL